MDYKMFQQLLKTNNLMEQGGFSGRDIDRLVATGATLGLGSQEVLAAVKGRISEVRIGKYMYSGERRYR